MNTMIEVNPPLRIIALDIETANLDMEAEGLKFDDPTGWQTAVVCIHNHYTDRDNVYVADSMLEDIRHRCARLRYDTKIHAFSMMPYHLRRWRNEGYLLLTHNGLGFDFPIMQKCVKDGGVGQVKSLLDKWPKNQMMDTCAVLTATTGVRYRLNHLIHGLLGEDESKLMDAANAPKEWAKKNYEEVIRYCIDDCRKTAQVYLKAGEEGEFRAIGKDEYRTVPINEYYTTWVKSQEV